MPGLPGVTRRCPPVFMAKRAPDQGFWACSSPSPHQDPLQSLGSRHTGVAFGEARSWPKPINLPVQMQAGSQWCRAETVHLLPSLETHTTRTSQPNQLKPLRLGGAWVAGTSTVPQDRFHAQTEVERGYGVTSPWICSSSNPAAPHALASIPDLCGFDHE